MEIELETCSSDALTEQDWRECLSVTLSAFKEHKDNGIQMYACSMNLDQLKQFLSNCHFFIVRSGGRIVAYRGVKLLKEGNVSFCAGRLVAVSPECRGKGIGKLLFKAFENFAMESDCEFLQTDTSCDAKSSQAYHHSCGFENWSYESWSNTNYYSVIMRKLLPPGRKISPKVRYSSLIRSYIRIHLLYDKFGQERIVGKCLRIPYRYMLKIFNLFS